MTPLDLREIYRQHAADAVESGAQVRLTLLTEFVMDDRSMVHIIIGLRVHIHVGIVLQW